MDKFLLNIVIFSSWAILLTGCSEPVDLTKSHSDQVPLCKIHHCPMQPERIFVGGEMIYYIEDVTIFQEQFPNHGGHRYNGEKDVTPYNKEVIDFVCPECDMKYYLYWKNKRKADVEISSSY